MSTTFPFDPRCARPPARLSKSRYLAALQCTKRLYFQTYHPDRATPVDPAHQAILDTGTEVGELARQGFPGGVLVDGSHRRISDALARTAALMADPAVPAIFEGAFEFGGVAVRVDILARVDPLSTGESHWQVIEVKSATKAKDVYVEDVAIQYYVLRGAGVSVRSAWLMCINSGYLFDGHTLDIARLFAWRDVTSAVMERLPAVPDRLLLMHEVLSRQIPPERDPGPHCHTPYECPFWDYCIKDKPARWVFHLPGGQDVPRMLSERGIHVLDDIPADMPLTAVQRRMKDNREWISAELAQRLDEIRYPVHHLDFETVMPAVPRYRATRPYHVLPVQWSDHIEYADGRIDHREFLYRGAEDPRPFFVASLLECLEGDGTICVYSSYERSILRGLAETFPEFAPPLAAAIARLWDLYQVIQDHYYHPGFAGSYSIKAVLPALVPTMGYEGLAIQDGSSAARAYYRMVFEETDWIEQERLAESLLRYCATDTRAMLEIRRVLKAKAQSSGALEDCSPTAR